MGRLLLGTIMLALIALPVGCAAVPAPTARPEAAARARVEEVHGRYRLVFEMASTTWRAGQPIDGTAVLQLLDGDVAHFSGSGGGPFGFQYVEVSGSRRVDPVWTGDCALHQLRADAPLVTELKKSGGYSADAPDAQFYHSFFRDPDVKLSAGVWDITAVANFIDGVGCPGPVVDLQATIRIAVK